MRSEDLNVHDDSDLGNYIRLTFCLSEAIYSSSNNNTNGRRRAAITKYNEQKKGTATVKVRKD